MQDQEEPAPENSELRSELKALLNKHSQETPSNTPDYVLADYLLGCLAAFNQAVGTRDGWGRLKTPRGESIGGYERHG